MSSDKARIAWLLLAVSTLALLAILFRYTVVLAPNDLGRGYRLDRWTGDVIVLVEGKKAPVTPFEKR